MGLRGEVVHLVGFYRREQRHQARAIGEVAVMKEQSRALVVGVDVEMIDARGVERRGPTDQPMDFIPLGEQQFGKIRPVLSSYAGDEGTLHSSTTSSFVADAG